MKKKFFTICAIVFLGFTGCTHRESANIDLTTSSVGVIETSGNSKKSRIYFYNQNLEKTATLPLEYASLGSIFYNPVIYEDEVGLLLKNINYIIKNNTSVIDEKLNLISLLTHDLRQYAGNPISLCQLLLQDDSLSKKSRELVNLIAANSSKQVGFIDSFINKVQVSVTTNVSGRICGTVMCWNRRIQPAPSSSAAS